MAEALERSRNAPVGLYAPIVRVKAGSPCFVFITGQVVSYYMHWSPRISRTQPCTVVACSGCAENQPRRPLTYAGCYHWRLYDGNQAWKRTVLEVPIRAGLRIAELQHSGLSLCRAGSFGTVKVEERHFNVLPENLESFDITIPLRQLWRLSGTVQFTLVSSDTM
jgi:hypothetical protein